MQIDPNLHLFWLIPFCLKNVGQEAPLLGSLPRLALPSLSVWQLSRLCSKTPGRAFLEVDCGVSWLCLAQSATVDLPRVSFYEISSEPSWNSVSITSAPLGAGAALESKMCDIRGTAIEASNLEPSTSLLTAKEWVALGGLADLFLGGIRLREFLLGLRTVERRAQVVQLLNRGRGHYRK